MGKQFVIGIDLGTTNSALAYAPLASNADPHELPGASLFSIPQVVNPGEVRDETLLPSFLYLPGAVDFPEGSLALPWDERPEFRGRVPGAEARGGEPGRLVSSAKSWLAPRRRGPHGSAAAVPNAPDGVQKLSPVEASARYLEHMRRRLGLQASRTRRSPSSRCW